MRRGIIAALGLLLAALLGLQPTVAASSRTLTVHQGRTFCLAHRASRGKRVVIRGFYAHYPFFGNPPYQTGYILGKRAPVPLTPADTVSGIVVRGPGYASPRPVPDKGWLRISGKLDCTQWPPSLKLRSWSLPAGTAPAVSLRPRPFR